MNNIDTYSFLLNKDSNKKSVNKDMTLNVEFSGNKKILPGDSIFGTINAYDVYVDERSKSNKFRLIFNINSVCSNVLFNPFTEIIRNEGSDNVVCLNFQDISNTTMNGFVEEGERGVVGKVEENKPEFVWNEYQAIRDTQISNERFGFDYHCGLDIFNNHILRSHTFKSINYSDKSVDKIGSLQSAYGDTYNNVCVVKNGTPHSYIGWDFNTIDDYARDKYGYIIPEEAAVNAYSYSNGVTSYWQTFVTNLPLHVYENSDIYSFNDCIRNKKIEDNGWYGFSNPSTFSYSILTKNPQQQTRAEEANIEYEAVDLGINKTINNRNYCEFIDLYPGRDLYSFVPKYNPYRERLEYNWNYYLTYPSESTVYYNSAGNDFLFPFFTMDRGRVALRALMFDENVVDDNGINVLTVYSVCKHGLMVGDTVNIYKSYNDENNNNVVELPYEAASVLNVVDNYIFQVAKNDTDISKEWLELTNIPPNYTYQYNNKSYYVTEGKRVNIDSKAQNIFFRRVVDNVECEYYVRKFSRLPNFKFNDEEVNDYTLYDSKYNRAKKASNKPTLLEKFSDPKDKKTFFESHISKLGFSKNAYGDDNTELVFTDDIDVSYLRDNLGRPLSDIYLTIVKNNKGYKEWYGLDNTEQNLNLPEVEYSHCFGKVNSSFLLSEYYRITKSENNTLFDVRDVTGFNGKGLLNNGTDEIDFYKDYEYYGDICCFSPADCEERVLQTAMHRFNTVQREISLASESPVKEKFSRLCVDEILDDDYNVIIEDFIIPDDFYEYFNKEPHKAKHTKKVYYDNMTTQTEGYYYQPHYRVPIKTVSDVLSSSNAVEYNLYKVENNNEVSDSITIFEIKTVETNDFCKNEKLTLYKRSTNEYFYLTVTELITSERFKCKIENCYGEYVTGIDNFLVSSKIDDFVLLKKHADTPAYARLAKDGSCQYHWREVIANGFENEATIYPFANGAFYITQQINFFLRRQDPTEEHMYNALQGIEYDELIPDVGEFIETTPNIETDYYENNIEPC